MKKKNALCSSACSTLAAAAWLGGAIDETVVHAQNVTGVDCKICLYILALYLLHPCVRLSATVALEPRRIAVCAFRVSLMGGAGEKKSCGFRGCGLW